MTVNLSQRLLLRAARRIHDSLDSMSQPPRMMALPEGAFYECKSANRRLRVAVQQGWRTAATRIRAEFRYSITSLIHDLKVYRDMVPEDDVRQTIQPVSEIYRDLVALQQEFAEIHLDFNESQMTVTTHPIELEEVELGSFEIVLGWNRIADARPYKVKATAPHPACTDSRTTHPHVLDDALCEGEGKAPIRSALKQGRLLDFFVLVRQVLENYNLGSAYAVLEDWDGVGCRDCGGTMSEDDMTSCTRCDRDMCSNCATCCESCGRTCCTECCSGCSGCDKNCCTTCSQECRGCSESVCPACLIDDRCTYCHESEQEPNENDTTSPENEGKLPTPILRFSPYAWAKLLFLRDLGQTEVGGFGISHAGDPFCVDNLRLVRQRCTSVTVQFDDQSVADFFDVQVDEGRTPAECGRLWIHTHPGHSAAPSSIDEETFARCFGSADWAVMFILAQRGETYARLRFNVGPGGELEIPVETDFGIPFSCSDRGAWEREYTECVEAEPLLRLPTGEPLRHLAGAGSPFAWDDPEEFSFIGQQGEIDDFYDRPL